MVVCGQLVLSLLIRIEPDFSRFGYLIFYFLKSIFNFKNHNKLIKIFSCYSKDSGAMFSIKSSSLSTSTLSAITLYPIEL